MIKITGKNPRKIADDIKRTIADSIPKKVKQMALQHFDDSFKQQGWTGGVYLSWQKRKGKSKKNNGRALLIKSGRLRRSIRGRIEPGKVIISTDVPYAQIHNEGGEIRRNAMSRLYINNHVKKGKNKGKFTHGTKKGRGATIGSYTIRIPKRQFMGRSSKLERDMQTMIETEFKKAIT